MASAKLPADYAIDGLALEADRKAKQLGRAYSYGMLVADTTLQQREEIAEGYRKRRMDANRKGRHRVCRESYLIPEQSNREVEDAVCQKLEGELEE